MQQWLSSLIMGLQLRKRNVDYWRMAMALTFRQQRIGFLMKVISLSHLLSPSGLDLLLIKLSRRVPSHLLTMQARISMRPSLCRQSALCLA
jgi:hypothetical protein